ncbi:MAG TPA: hypothetical protein VK154_12200 [Chitinophagales bacterium]|nr:hypothetical protein [Chitinophagales bacterium]
MKTKRAISYYLYLLAILNCSVVLLYSCSEKKTQKKKYNQTNSEVELIPPAAQEPPEEIARAQIPVPVIEFDFFPNPDYTPWQGTRIAQAKWQDLRGNNVLILSARPQFLWSITKPELKKFAKNEDETEAAEFFAVHYIYNNDSARWKKHWNYYEVKLADYDISIDYIPGTLIITDIDSNGLAESAFSYSSCIGTQALDFNYSGTMIFHIDTTEFKIKGPLGLRRNTEGSSGRTTFSTNYSDLAMPYQGHLSQLWQRNIIVRDSLDRVLQKMWE